jgi:[acyl-carrier-protein] S-malonyltransferase
MSLAFCFPGQGSQAVGMGKALAESFGPAREVFERVDVALGEKLSALMWEGPEETLRQTENAQPALMAVSMAAVEVLRQEFGVGSDRAAYLAGHSLGEATALCAAGSIGLEETALLLRRRGLAMAQACPPGEGSMAALIGADYEVANRACAAGSNLGVCQVANDNAPGQIVISGARLAVERAVEAAQALGVKRAILLPVSGPFHSALMQPAAQDLAAALTQIELAPPSRPIVCNVTAHAETDPAALKRLLVEQMTARVRWRESVEWMAESGVTRFVEIGAGKVLTGLAKRIVPDAKGETVGTPDEVAAFAASLDATP